MTAHSCAATSDDERRHGFQCEAGFSELFVVKYTHHQRCPGMTASFTSFIYLMAMMSAFLIKMMRTFGRFRLMLYSLGLALPQPVNGR